MARGGGGYDTLVVIHFCNKLIHLKASPIHLLKEDTPGKVERGNALQDSRGTKDLEKVANDDEAATQRNGATDEDDVGLEQDDIALPDANLDNRPDASSRGLRRVLSRIRSSISPAPSDEEEIQAYMPNYRTRPILSGVIVPFCILLEVPGLTQDWCIRFHSPTMAASKPKPPLLEVAMVLSILCAVLANVCLVVRFLEKHIMTTTILCILFLLLHDIVNIVVLTTFGATDDDYSCDQAFWMIFCSVIVSMFTNVILIIDLIRTPNFARSGSGLTRRQRSLVIIIIGLFCYIALGALVNSLLLDLTFVDGLYFTVVTIEAIGFGDIAPNSKGSRIFICIYAMLGVINLAFVVGYVRETVLEGLDFGYRRRLLAIQERRRATHRRRRADMQWNHAIVRRLRERHAPVWIAKRTNNRKSIWLVLRSCFWRAVQGIRSTAGRNTHHGHGCPGMQLNLWALPPCQLKAAALEAGCTLDTFLPENFYDTYNQDVCHHTVGVEHHALPSWFSGRQVYGRDECRNHPLTHRLLGAVPMILPYEFDSGPLPGRLGVQDDSAANGLEVTGDSSGSLQTSSSDGRGSYRRDVEDVEKKAYYTRSSLSFVWLLIFWMGGAVIFKATEGWSYGSAVYFCFISLMTIGYGDSVLTTPAGRSVFVVWALIGVATVTIFISVVSEAYNSRYKDILGRSSFNHFVRQYRKRKRAELIEKVQRMGTLTQGSFVPRDPSEHDFIKDESSLASATTPVPSPSQPDWEVHHAQSSLKGLPRQVLNETRSIEQYMQLIGQFDRRSIESEFVGGTVWSLIDEVMDGRELTRESRKDILKDEESRRTLMLLGIERSLKVLVDIFEKAIETIQERNRVTVPLEQEKGQDETDITA